MTLRLFYAFFRPQKYKIVIVTDTQIPIYFSPNDEYQYPIPKCHSGMVFS